MDDKVARDSLSLQPWSKSCVANSNMRTDWTVVDVDGRDEKKTQLSVSDKEV